MVWSAGVLGVVSEDPVSFFFLRVGSFLLGAGLVCLLGWVVGWFGIGGLCSSLGIIHHSFHFCGLDKRLMMMLGVDEIGGVCVCVCVCVSAVPLAIN